MEKKTVNVIMSSPQPPCFIPRVSAVSSTRFMARQKRGHNTTRIPRLGLSAALCFILTLGPSIFAPLSSSSQSSVPVCSAAPALWTPIADVLGISGELFGSLFHKPQGQPAPTLEDHSASINALNNSMDVNEQSTSNPSSGIRVVATANDFGVVQLDLEGDPNCDYTTKVRIAGFEFNVIIDTGSAHFAVASSACRDCIIPRKDHYHPNEEEDIPIDADYELLDGSSRQSQKNVMEPSAQEPLHLVRSPPRVDPSSASTSPSFIRSSDPPATTTTISPALLATQLSTTVLTATSSSALTSSIFPTSTGVSNAAVHTSMTSPIIFHSSLVSIVVHATNLRFPEMKNHLEVMHSSLMAFPTPALLPPTLAASSLRAATLSTPTEYSTSDTGTTTTSTTTTIVAPTHIGTGGHFGMTNVAASSSRAAASVTSTMSSTRGLPILSHVINSTRSVEKHLAAVPAENLYRLSEQSRERGQTVRVSYGIKSHSVGWSGVMTSDLMTLNMAKVEPKGLSGTAASFPIPGALPGTTTELLGAGATMEKETNVEFAAIVENNGFFSKECGAQHGIWGLGYRSLSVDRRPTLFDTLSASMKIPNGFALQLCGRTSNTTKSGNMFLGGYSNAHLAEPMQYVSLVKKDWYQVQLDGFKVMGAPVQGMQNLNLPKTIVDSGTTNILMSHYNLQFLIRSMAQSDIVRWSGLIPEEDISNFWFRNAVLRLPRSTFQVSTAARAVEVVMSGVSVPIYTSSFLRIKPVPAGLGPEGYVDFWWHGFASSTAADAVEAEAASGGAVMPGSVGTILGETLFSGKVVYFERGNEDAQPGDADFGRIGFGRGKNCFAPANHASVDVLASDGRVAMAEGLGPVRVAATSEANAIKKSGGSSGKLIPVHATAAQGDSQGNDDHTAKQAQPSAPPTITSFEAHIPGFSGPIRLMGSASRPLKDLALMRRAVAGLVVAMIATVI